MSQQPAKPNVFTNIGASNHSERIRVEDDYYATEPKAMELLLDEETFSENIWECACGGGHLSNVLKEHGYNVYSTDLVDRGFGVGGVDFLKVDTPFDGDIITNPPYKYAREFVEHALELVNEGRKVAMFLKIQFLETKSRRELFEKAPPRTIYVSSSRLNCARNGEFETYPFNSAVCYAWFVWEKGFHGDPIIKWIN